MPSLESKLRLSRTPQYVTVIYNALKNLYFVRCSVQDQASVAVACSLSCNHEVDCTSCSKFRSAIVQLSKQTTRACSGVVSPSTYAPVGCAPLEPGESALRSAEIFQWWNEERPLWAVNGYDEGFQVDTVPFGKKVKQSEFRDSWKLRYPNRPQYTPNPVQRKVLNKLARNETSPKAFLLYWALGSGKTLMALFYSALFKFKRLLIVCSKTMVAQWLEPLQSAKCLLPGTVAVLITYDKFEMLAHDLNTFPSFDAVVVDECHYYKNLNEAKSASFQLLCRHFPVTLLLSGTPLRHTVEELEMYRLIFGLPSLQVPWTELAASARANLFAGGVSHYDPSQHSSVDWHYPKVNEHSVRYPMSPLHTLAYLCKSGRDHILVVNGVRIPTWGRGDELSRNSLINQCEPYPGAGLVSSKLIALLANVRNCAGPQVVFSMYKHFHRELLAALSDFRVRVLTGSESPEERTATRKAFLQGEVDVLILCRVGSTGLDLYSARTLHVLEPQNNEAETNQVVGRVVRGSLEPYEYAVDIYSYCCTLGDAANSIADKDLRECEPFFKAYPEVRSAVLQVLAEDEGEVLELKPHHLARFLRLASVAEGGTVEEKRLQRNREGARELQNGLEYLRKADIMKNYASRRQRRQPRKRTAVPEI